MSSTFTATLTDAVSISDQYVQLDDVAGITEPGSSGTFNATPCYLQIDSEFMQVAAGYVFGSEIVPVIRGINGTLVKAHAAGTPVTVTIGFSSAISE